MTIEPYEAEVVEGEIVDEYSEDYTEPEMPDGLTLIRMIERYLDYLAKWPDVHTRRTVALWIMHTHARTDKGNLIWSSTPRLWFKSKDPGSGKSWAMAIASFLCPVPKLYVEPSEPAVIHSVGKLHGTLFLDELDELLKAPNRKTAVKVIMNAGYTKIPPTTWPRVRNNEVEEIPTFGALAFAGLEALETRSTGNLNALLTRCIRIPMVKAPDNYSPPEFGDKEWQVALDLRGLIAAWAADNLDALKAHKPELPDGVGNRLAQLWRPLFSVADIIGGKVPELARKTCVSITKTAANGMSAEVANQVVDQLGSIMAHWENPKPKKAIADKTPNRPALPDLSRFKAPVKPDTTDTSQAALSMPVPAQRKPAPTDTRGRILATLGEHGELDGKDLARLSGVPYGNCRVTCGRMRDSEQLVQNERGKWDIAPGHEPIVVRDNRAAHLLS